MLESTGNLWWLYLIVTFVLFAFVGASNSTQSDHNPQSSHSQDNHAVIVASVMFLMIPTACGIGGISLLVYRYKQYLQKKNEDQSKRRMVICYQDEDADINVMPFQTQMFTAESVFVENPVHVVTTTALSTGPLDKNLAMESDSTELSVSTADTVNLYFLTFQAWLQSPPKFSLTSTVDTNANNDQGGDIEHGTGHIKGKAMSTLTSGDGDSRVSWMPKLRMPRLKRHEQISSVTHKASIDTADTNSNVSDLTLTPPFGEDELETVDWLDEDDEDDDDHLAVKKEGGFRRWLNSGSSRKRSASYTLRI